MTGSRDMAKNTQNIPHNGVLPHLRPPNAFLKKAALSHLHHHGSLTLCEESEKTNEQSLRYTKTDRWTIRPTDRPTDN